MIKGPSTEQPDVRPDYFDDIKKRAHVYPLPPADFDPLSATNAQLEQHGLPARPDQDTESELFQNWSLLLGRPFNVIVPEFPQHVGDLLPVLVYKVGRGGRRGFRRFENSRNWSGAYIVPQRPRRFVHMVGTWHVPMPSLPPVLPEDAVPGNDEYQSSTWIGIDGHRRYPNSSLPQIGTSQFFKVADGIETVTTAAWWQWWSMDGNFPPHDRNNPPVAITNFPVSVGDEISAGLTVEPAGDVHFYIKNQTTGLFTTFLVIAPGPILPLGSTAEWVMERPTVLGERRLYPLPNYTPVEFRNCLAQSAMTIGGTTITQRLDHAQLIRMYEVFANPHRTSFVSWAQKKSNTSVRVFYRDASAPGSGGLLV